MNLNMFCHDYWKQERKKEKSDDCGRIDLCTLIRNCKSGKISQEDKNALFQCVICRNSKLRKVWNQICRFIISFCVYTHYKSSCQAEEDIDRMKYYAFHYIEWEVEKCIQKFNPELLDCPDNKNALKLLSKYISNSLHYRIIKEALIDAILPYICETAEIMQMDFPEAMPGTFIVCAKKENNDEFKLICPYITDMLSTYFEQGVFPDHPVLERLVNMGYKIKSGYQVYQQVNIKNLPENVLISDIFSCYQDKGTANSPCARIEFSEEEKKQAITLIIYDKKQLRKTSQELSELIFSCSDQCDIPKMK
ncbi:MAG: hypothetical protein GY710_04060, partial [Desulfobacteraceae bacterium]|nr:hypothetical protein [Desulfobacteraceae bacterium]